MGSKKASPPPPASAGAASASASTSAAGASAGNAPAAVGPVPKPPELAPFLTKVYEMVSDPATDAVISWTKAGSSFVVWDAHAFERDHLGRHFKHGNFSSFIRQLNTYGFRKVDPDRWEWANEGFLRGQKHLLKTIKRKKRHNEAGADLEKKAPVRTAPAPGTENIEIGKYGGLVKEVETLKRDKALLMQQLVDLRHYQQGSNLEVQNLIQRLQVMEQNQQQMMALLAIVVQNPSFLNQLVLQQQQQQQQRRNNWWNADGSKKRRFPALVQGPLTDQETSAGGAEIIQYRPHVPGTSSQVIADETFCSDTAQPISSPALDMPMEMDTQTTSDNLNTLDSSWDFLPDTSALPDLDMDLCFDENGQLILEPPLEDTIQGLSVQDYDFPESEQDTQMEALQNYRNPQSDSR
ncbi:heat stress transcription factor A-9-like [Lolium rigidum]|uniref:heat stress transcription factor A-9-like n=1 Tax=Lolium rigidum TaxID=89674 RepID=UPI001F5DA116|nr:heat stress transcription factor A-9-like [Lolium rigidum]